MRVIASLLLFCLAAFGADTSASLLAAAAGGDSGEVQTLLDHGTPVDAKDKNGRTALMIAAEHGHADIVKLLLEKGAQPGARDRLGWTAYGLALLAPIGRGDHRQVLELLPAPPRVRLAVTSDWTPQLLRSSCFALRGDLPAQVARLHLDTVVVEEFLAYFGASGKSLFEIVRDSAGPADAIVNFTMRPGVDCVDSGDRLTLSIDTRLFRADGHQLLFEKSFAGGFKGLRSQSVNNVAQYAPVFRSWIRPQAAPMYNAIVEILYRSQF